MILIGNSIGARSNNMRVKCTNNAVVSLIAIISINLISACQPAGLSEPAVEIVVHQAHGKVTFEFFIHKASRWSGDMERVPTEIGAFILGKVGSTVVWEIESKDVGLGVRKIQFGVVPEKFIQKRHKNGEKPILEQGVEYEVYVAEPGFGSTTFLTRSSRVS